MTVAVECNITDSSFERNDGKAISIQSPGNAYIKNIRAANNTETGISVTGQNVTLESTRTSENGVGIGVGGAFVYMRNITIERNTGSGLSFEESSTAEIYNVNISANGGTGISSPFAGRLNIFNSSVTHNGGSGGLLVNLGTVTAEDTIFFNNTNGLSTDWYSSLTVKHCNIFGNRNHGIAQSERGGVDVHNSSIQGNVRDGIHGGGFFRLYNANISNNENGIASYGGGLIYNSFIQNNSGSGVWSQGPISAHVRMDGSVVRHNQFGVRVSQEEFSVSRSKIVDNVVGVYSLHSLDASSSTIANNSLANVDVQSLKMEYCDVSNSSAGIIVTSGSIHHSNIHNHTGYNIENTGGNDINATHNWWGTTNETAVEEKIYDFYDTLTLGRVFYKPYLTAPIEVDTTPPNITDISQKPEDNVQPEDEVKINATVNDNMSGVREVTLTYTYTNSSGSWNGVVEMTNLEGNIWNATIPALPAYTNVTYTIEAEDNVGNTITTEELGYELEYPVIPELPSFLILPFFIIMTMLTAVVARHGLLTKEPGKPAGTTGRDDRGARVSRLMVKHDTCLIRRNV